MDYLETGNCFQALSIKDVIEARDAYHVFLMRKQNVIGTAIGKKREYKKGFAKPDPKTLEHSYVPSDAVPCVLVFVKDWVKDEDFGQTGRAGINDYLPQQLYLPDGRVVPVCVIQAQWQTSREDSPDRRLKLPGSFVGGGYPVRTEVQGNPYWGTIGCLVTDGRLTYALTNGHVAGRAGERLSTLSGKCWEEFGTTTNKQLRKRPFSEVYDGFPGKHALLNLDIGLIELDNLKDVSSQIYGYGEVRGLADVNHDTLSLNLVGAPVVAYGCASDRMCGVIDGLFYRYTTSGGYDIVTDYLIGPRADQDGKVLKPFTPQPGDSGTLIIIDDPSNPLDRKAIGVLWGGQRDETGKCEQAYGLATNLGTILRLLDVELVSTWNASFDRYFGMLAHYTLPGLCVSVIQDAKLKDLMSNNKDAFSKDFSQGSVEDLKKNDGHPTLLGDVPDLIWRYRRLKEGPNHFADMDQPDPLDNNRTLFDLCEDTANITPEVWQKYDKDLNPKMKEKDEGLLPFRIAQIFGELKAAVGRGDKDYFVCAAGILTHYVFDACMPFHISYRHHGDLQGKMPEPVNGKKNYPSIHDEFDNAIVEYHLDDLKERLPDLVKNNAAENRPILPNSIQTPREAAAAAVTLMMDTRKNANPLEILKDFDQLVNLSKHERCDKLWEKYQDGLLQAMAEGAVFAARLWESAWHCGNGERNIQDTSAVDPQALVDKYLCNTNFLPSYYLKEIQSAMSWDS